MENLSPEPPSEIMLAPFKFSGEELARLVFRTSLKVVSLNALLFGIIIFITVAIDAGPAVGAFLAAGMIVLVMSATRIGLSRKYKQPALADLRGSRYISLSERGIKSRFECGVESSFPWSQIIHARVVDKCVILPMKLGVVAWVPQSIWTPEALELLKKHVKDVKLESRSL